MKKLIIAVLLVLMFCMMVQAEEAPIDDLLRASGADSLSSGIDGETADNMGRLGIGKPSQSDILSISMDKFFNVLINIIKQKSQSPLKMVFVIMGVILLCSLLKSAQNTFVLSEHDGVFDVVAILFISTTVLIPLSNTMTLVGTVIKNCTSFMALYIPVFAGVIIANGQVVTASVYTTLLMGATESVSGICGYILIPFMSIYFALSLVGAASPNVKISAVSDFVKRVVIAILTAVSTVFVILLSVQSIVSSAADTLTLKTAKFLSGSFIPFVGGAIAEAISTLSGCMQVLKVTVGVYGIIVIALIFLPLIAELLLWQLAMSLSQAVSELFDISALTSLLKCAQGALKVMLAITLICAALFIISTTIMITVGMGTA